MKKIFTLSAAIIFSVNGFSQAPAIQWQKCFGGISADVASSIQLTNDGGYIVAGCTSSNDGDVSGNHGGIDCRVLKLDSVGNIEWQKCLGGTSYDVAYSIQTTDDGGYIVAGVTTSNDGDVSGWHSGYDSMGNPLHDCWILKLDSIGNILWQKCLGGTNADGANSVQQTTDGEYIVAGWSNSYDGDATGNHGNIDCWIVKLDSVGNIQWQKSLGGTNADVANSVQETVNGGYIVAGSSNSNSGDVTGNHGNYDYWVVKTNSIGNIQWQKSLGGTDADAANSVLQTVDSGYIVVGYTRSENGDVSGSHDTSGFSSDYWVVKLDTAGNVQWQRCLGGTSSDHAYSIQQSADGGFILVGLTGSNDGDVSGYHGGPDYWIVKTDYSGQIQWQKCLGGTNGDIAYSVQQTNDGGYILAGKTGSYDGDVSGNHGGVNDFWIVKLSPDVGIEEHNPLSSINISPNPATSEITVHPDFYRDKVESIEVYNVMGERVIFSLNPSPSPAGEGSASMDVSKLAAGIYFVKVLTENGMSAAKFVKQ
ncbi:MAG TPA: T9SS type A sorting domain-containing protein [Bacteroidia bacterium]|nr:T9SS type A sorting domain-containing protein [Bacteroidia bacterium]